ncbi:M48 family metallopeptidase [Cryobacterium breve]|uniref:M48 family metallopeptidase n=1 Tax=Cryobacterium breve TaxID=1259258 RepID=A0ABY7NF33_9MICO|nr:SprT family zinc-dependent metalloprotease [Cryobacterium breve]WBM79138.1 M48 family metallopeptidase [Cryobacterium breve]
MNLTAAYGSHSIEYSLVRRDRATLEITVQPDGTVEVVAPMASSALEIERRITKRARWILRQQEFFGQFLPRTPQRQWVPGETHLYLGRHYRLRIGERANTRQVRLIRGFFVLDGVDFDDNFAIESLVNAWYRVRARVQFERSLQRCQKRFATPESFEPASVQLRRMPTRWGSMSARGRLSLNPGLVRAPADAIDYVITHELCHLAVANHGPAFSDLLSVVMPDWEQRKFRLERALA